MSTITVNVAPHPLLDAGAFVSVLPRPLSELPSPEGIRERLSLEADVPLHRDEETRKAVRDLLRHGGYKPTGRGKPASEYLVKAATGGGLGSINLAVDACNVVSLHSGLPISVVDLDRATAPFRIAVAEAGTRYVFNLADQEIDCSGLLCLHDAEGPCANGVKDAQRTKTTDDTGRTLSVVWGTSALEGRTAEVVGWYRRVLMEAGVTTEDVVFQPG